MTVHRARKSVQVWQTVAVLLLVTLCSSGAPELFIDENWNRSPSGSTTSSTVGVWVSPITRS